MEQEEFKKWLKVNNLTNSKLSELTGISEYTIRNWRQGLRAIPAPMVAYIDLYNKCKLFAPKLIQIDD